eukprot:scaffold43044_cov52-Phaeocystis_antarctica.AAC.1
MNSVAMCTPSGRGRCPMAVARSQIPEDYTRIQRWRTGAKTSLPGRRWLQTSGPTIPWRVPGSHVDAVGGSPGDLFGGAVSHSSLPAVKVRRRGRRVGHLLRVGGVVTTKARLTEALG